MKCPSCGSPMKEAAKFCTACGAKTAAPASPTRPMASRPSAPASMTAQGLDQRFQHNKFLFNQPILRIRDVYNIYDEHDNELFFARRLLIALKRHISIYTDKSQSNEILKILQDNFLMILYARYTLVDMNGTVIAKFRRRNIISILRRTWEVQSPEGALLGIVKEDSWGKAIFRRFGPLGEYFKTDFIFEFGGRVIGRYIRKWTIQDKYILDMTEDSDRVLDRRVAVAMGVLLDTGEMR